MDSYHDGEIYVYLIRRHKIYVFGREVTRVSPKTLRVRFEVDDVSWRFMLGLNKGATQAIAKKILLELGHRVNVSGTQLKNVRSSTPVIQRGNCKVEFSL